MDIVRSSVRKAVQFSRLANTYRGNPEVQLTWEQLSEQWSRLAATEESLSPQERAQETARLLSIEGRTMRRLGIRTLAD
jgi:hypothetical protein